MNTKHALIIGGGIAGLSTGCALKRIGWKVSVFERAPEIGEVGAALHIWHNATNALREFGMYDKIAGYGEPVYTCPINDHRMNTLIDLDITEIDRDLGVQSFGIRRPDLVEGLSSGLTDEEIHLDHDFESFEQDDEGVIARFKNGNTARGDVLIAADGIKSAIRAHLFPEQTERQPIYCGYIAWRALLHFPDPAWKDQLNFLCIGTGTQFGMCELPDDTAYWFATKNMPESEIYDRKISKSEIQSVFKDYGGPVRDVLAATEEEAIISNGIYELEPTKPWAKGRVVLIGDAAHATTPNLGQGGCMAIEDAAVIARCLGSQLNIPSALQEFESLRFDRSARITLASRQIGNSVQHVGWLGSKVRNISMKYAPQNQNLNAVQFMRHRVPSMAGQVKQVA